MTREEAIELVCYGDWLNILMPHLGDDDINRLAEAMCIIGNALRPVSREQVERMRGQWQWYKPCRESPEKWWGICSTCGHKQLLGEGEVNFCPSCGAPMTDEAVEMVMERLEVLHGETD